MWNTKNIKLYVGCVQPFVASFTATHSSTQDTTMPRMSSSSFLKPPERREKNDIENQKRQRRSIHTWLRKEYISLSYNTCLKIANRKANYAF